MFCTGCGKEIHDDALICVNCGVGTNKVVNSKPVESNWVNLWGILGCCLPVFGIIAFIIMSVLGYKKSARAVGIGMLIALILFVLYFVIVFVLAILIEMQYY